MAAQTNISLDMTTVLILLSAASTLVKINRAKNHLKGTDTQDEALQGAVSHTAERIRETIGE
jgi:hypothetical protein